MQTRHIPVLDGLRGLAVLLVLWDHLPQVIFPSWFSELGRTIRAGNTGVDLFFVLSGFLITRILLAEREEGVPVRFFLLRRAARIFPIYYLLLFAMTFLRPHPDIAWCAVYLSNYSTMMTEPGPPSFLRHTWSLCVEEHFYSCWPLLVSFLPLAWSRRLIAFVVVPGSIVAGAVLLLLPSIGFLWAPIQARLDSGALPQFDRLGIAWFGTQTRVLSLAIGSLFAYRETALRGRPGRGLAAAAIGLGSAWAVSRGTPSLCAGLERLFGRPFPLESWSILTGVVATSLATSSILLAVLATERLRFAPTRLLTAAPLAAVGRISYGLYLYHLPLFGLLGIHRYARQDRLAVVWGLLALLFAVATLSYFVIERPILRWASGYRAARVRVASAVAP